MLSSSQLDEFSYHLVLLTPHSWSIRTLTSWEYRIWHWMRGVMLSSSQLDEFSYHLVLLTPHSWSNHTLTSWEYRIWQWMRGVMLSSPQLDEFSYYLVLLTPHSWSHHTLTSWEYRTWQWMTGVMCWLPAWWVLLPCTAHTPQLISPHSHLPGIARTFQTILWRSFYLEILTSCHKTAWLQITQQLADGT